MDKRYTDRKEWNMKKRPIILALIAVMFFAGTVLQVEADVVIQCPCPPGTLISPETGNIECQLPGPPVRDIACRHITGGDGFVNMADGTSVYVFGFSEVTGLASGEVMTTGELAAAAPAP
jgi:hypothetical protein